MRNGQNGRTGIGDVLPEEPGVVRFLDTVWADRAGPHDDLATPAQAATWLSRTGYAELPDLTADDAAELRELRDALRRLAAYRTEDTRARAESPIALGDALMVVNSVASAPTAGPRITVSGPAGFEQVSMGGPTARDALGMLAREGVAALTPPEDLPLRACLAPSCVLYYVHDHPRRTWCSAACGNRARAARHYARTKG